jgi:ABC-type glycerol-3-phosphate transport system substrate-binding protein
MVRSLINKYAQYGILLPQVAAMTTIGHWIVPEYSQLEFAWDVAPFPEGPLNAPPA